MKNQMDFIWGRFKEIEQFRTAFKLDFTVVIFDTFKRFYPDVIIDTILIEKVNLFGEDILNALESVIDKDKSYPEFRKKQELNTMLNLLKKQSQVELSPDFKDLILQKTKGLMVEYETEVFNLSAIGFRLLDANAKYHTTRFFSDIHPLINS